MKRPTTISQAIAVGIEMGEPKSFDQVFVRFYAPLCQFALRYLPTEADAEDVVENIFIRLWNKAERFENVDHARASLYRATYHACLNHLRGRQRSLVRDGDYVSAKEMVDESYLANFLKAELVALLHREIDRLPEKYAAVLRLSFRDDLRNEEIAERLHLSLQTVKNYKSEGLALLKKRVPQDLFILLASTCLPW